MELPTRLGGLLLAQVDPLATPSAPAVTTDAASVVLISLERWYKSLTLSSPSALPSRTGWIAFLAGVAGLLLLAILTQGPKRAIAQFLDLAGLSRCLSGGIARLRRSARMVAILLGITVISWTAWQAPLHGRVEKKEELALLMKSKTRLDVAFEQGSLAALTPFRDLVGLGDSLIFLAGAAALAFKFSADRWGRFDDRGMRGQTAGSGWTTVCWGAAGLYAMYRLASLIVLTEEGFRPLGGCLFVEVAVIPVLMLVSDALLLSWILVELRGHPDSDDEQGFDVAGTIALMPAAILACLCAMPSRYAGMTVGLAYFYHLPTKIGDSPYVLAFLRGWGLAWLQAGSFLTVGVIGAAAWSHGRAGLALSTYGRLLRAEGGRLAAMMALAGLVVGAGTGLAYFSVLALPAQPWLLLAADSYAHYASLPIGLVMMAGLVELASRVAPSMKNIVKEEEETLRIGDDSLS